MVFYVYSSSLPWSFTNELVQQTMSDTNLSKLQAVDIMNATARPAVTLGKLVPATIYLKDPASQALSAHAVEGALNGPAYLLRPGSSHYTLVPLRTTAAGNYLISVNLGGRVTGSVALHVNGVDSGTINIGPTASGTVAASSKVAVRLPVGLSVLRLDSPKGSGDIFVRDVVVE